MLWVIVADSICEHEWDAHAGGGEPYRDPNVRWCEGCTPSFDGGPSTRSTPFYYLKNSLIKSGKLVLVELPLLEAE